MSGEMTADHSLNKRLQVVDECQAQFTKSLAVFKDPPQPMTRTEVLNEDAKNRAMAEKFQSVSSNKLMLVFHIFFPSTPRPEFSSSETTH